MGARRTKNCQRCRRMKSLAQYGCDRSKLSGLSNYCRDCAAVMAKESRTRRAQGKTSPRGRRASSATVDDVIDATATVRIPRIERILQQHEDMVNAQAAV